MAHERALIITDGGVGGLLACWSEGVVRAGLLAAAGRRREERAAGRDAQENDPRPVAWLAPLPLPARSRRREAVARHVELCSLLSVVERPVELFEREVAGAMGDAEVVLNDVVGGGGATRLLLAAAEDAARLGIPRIVWPVHLGDGWGGGSQQGMSEREAVERAAGVFERALLVSQLASIDLADRSRGERAQAAGRAGRGGRDAQTGVTIETPYLDFTDAQLMELAIDLDCPVVGAEGAWVCEREAAAGCGQCASCVRWRRALRTVDPAGAAAVA